FAFRDNARFRADGAPAPPPCFFPVLVYDGTTILPGGRVRRGERRRSMTGSNADMPAAQPRAIVVQDISCVGRCSLTVALPVLSAAGVNTAVVPTALLSTHTGEF